MLFAKAASIYRAVLTWCSEAATALIFVMMLLITGDVFGRYSLSKPISGALELTELLMVFVVFLAYAHTEATGHNIRIQIIDKYLADRQIYFLNAFGSLIGMFIFAVITWQGWLQAWWTIEVDERTAGVVRFALWPAKFALVLGGFLLTFQFFVSAVSNIRRGVLKG